MKAGYPGRRLLLAAPLLVIVAACATEVPGGNVPGENVGSQQQAAIGTSLSTYTLGSDVVVTYDNMSGAASDWVAIAEVGTPDDKFLKWQYTAGDFGGSRTFSGLPGGTYEARAYFDWAGTSSYEVQYRISFVIAGTPNPALTPPATTAVNAPIQIAYSGLPGNRTDWIAVALPGSPSTSFLRWGYTNGATSGTTNFPGLPAGSYVARAFYDYQGTASFDVQHEASFTVSESTGGPSLTLPTSPSSSTQINVGFASFPGYASDWVAIAAAGSPDNAFLRWKYTNGGLSGTVAFGTLPDGAYEARAYANWTGTSSYNVIARQAFTVAAPVLGPQRVLVYNSNGTWTNLAATRAGATTVTRTTTDVAFNTAFDAGNWDVVHVDAASGTPAGIKSRIMARAGTGRIIYGDFNLNNDPAMRTALGISSFVSYTTPQQVRPATDAALNLFTLQDTLPAPLLFTHDAGDNGDFLTLAAGGTVLLRAGDATTGQILAGRTNGGMTIVNGFVGYDFQARDADTDGVPDIVELFANEYRAIYR